MKQSPLIRPLLMTLKTIIFKAQLNDTYQGGLNSYALMSMLLAFLQYQNTKYQYLDKPSPIFASEISDPRLLGRQLLDFLYFYGFQFQP